MEAEFNYFTFVCTVSLDFIFSLYVLSPQPWMSNKYLKSFKINAKVSRCEIISSLCRSVSLHQAKAGSVRCCDPAAV